MSRRGLLSLAVVAAGGMALSPRAPQVDSLPPTPEAPPVPMPGPPPWKNRDPLLTAPLSTSAHTLGAISRYEAAFPALNTKAVVPLPGLANTTSPWLAASIVGPVNQLQIVNPETETPAHVVSIPDSHNGGIESLVWHMKTRTLYLGTGSKLYSWNPKNPQEMRRIGEVPGASTLYDLTLDSAGNLWGGTYPNGSTFTYTVATGKIRAHSRLAADTDYVRRVAIGPDDVVWAGTGSVNPRLFTFPAARPGQRTEVQLPNPMTEGFISSIEVLGDRVVVMASDIDGQLLLDPATLKWVGTVDRKWSSRKVSPLVEGATTVYTVTKNELYATDTATWQDTLLGVVETNAPLSLQADGQRVLVTSELPTGLRLEYFSLSERRVETRRTLSLTTGEYKIQSLMGHSDGNIYIGGYMGQGIASVNPDTNARWHSPHDERLINQIEAMIEFDAERTYIGSYGSADIIGLKSAKKDTEEGYSRLDRLRTEYHQSRPFGWATNSTNVFFGTVPDYGRAGGVLGMIDPRSNKIAWVLDGAGKGFIRAHSIIGLAADDRYVYGTSSVRNGYGIPDTTGAAKVFKLEISTRTKVWETAPVAQTGALYAPKLIAGWLVVADIEGINIIDPATGRLATRHRLTQGNNATSRPGWANADIAQVGDGSKVVHSAAGTTTVVDFRAGSSAVIGSQDSKERFGARLASTPTGRVFGYTDKTVLVELDLLPATAAPGSQRPSKPTTSPSTSS
ncbi:hypothetical protein [Paeniglutamicibacter antarcticus]|uniref:hypothetical protein n=1 Tax=Paeniglutamicibacter antarcticus TaxID=494023 RepID=UPI001AE4C782